MEWICWDCMCNEVEEEHDICRTCETHQEGMEEIEKEDELCEPDPSGMD